jgi:hypothetical protein
MSVYYEFDSQILSQNKNLAFLEGVVLTNPQFVTRPTTANCARSGRIDLTDLETAVLCFNPDWRYSERLFTMSVVWLGFMRFAH